MDVFQDTLFRDLEKLHYTVNESKVYLTLIKTGPSFAGRISKEANLDRSSTYNALNYLIQKGIVSTLHENKRTIYIPENPKKILEYYQEKEEIAKTIIPKLQEQFSFKKTKSTVKFFQGFKGVKTVFQDILDSSKPKSTYFVIGSEGYFSKKMPYFSPTFLKMKEQKEIKAKILIREGREKKKKDNYTEYKTIPSKTESPVTINIYENKIAIFIWEETPQGILIENENVSKTLKDYFEFMWKNA